MGGGATRTKPPTHCQGEAVGGRLLLCRPSAGGSLGLWDSSIGAMSSFGTAAIPHIGTSAHSSRLRRRLLGVGTRRRSPAERPERDR